MISAEEQRLIDTPVSKRMPCVGCRFLSPVKHGTEVSKNYGRCDFVPPGPFAYWQYNTYAETARWRTLKYINGPHTPDAELVICEVREP